ncbi:hypothetical protein A3C59_03265 [Candidatus Daviesbacteria bacterium RIFCSPHIGHO2_02_FULL_36_13]|uniref:Uncharacterized protein n=1 Tax=Candidatus Daviesbacteria bacterium RIFCSPHIGHO2_02_FULL_36_13 TaxID=1797768 RepID=A0A1F5JQ46_9BACT|nr:MAG: hypothetical protein A3C59_03265 [Candidatus Daviesbacteria bacterium RIFCSPHIGHO2_02_FULL_36_13]OGE41608.1 MAG: hypothetical protein A3A45_02485 [Candidatus Daviesbacteria bacterium RIFCSPLOWO2_01_FULL_36_8]
MPRFSVYTDPKKLSIFIHRFWDVITLLEERVEVIAFFTDLLTPTEVRMLAKRLQIADMLAKGYKYEDIKNYTRVTVQTISHVNNKLQFGENGLIKILQKLGKIDKARQDKIEGKRSIFSQPPGLGRMAGDLVTLGARGVEKVIRNQKKIRSVKGVK